MVKKIAIFGSTGTIGINTLRVVDRFPDQFKVIALTAFNNCKLLEQQVRKYRPQHVAVNAKGVDYLRKNIALKNLKIWNAQDDISGIAALKEVDIVLLGIKGAAALMPFLSALRSGKTVAPANKEAIVMAGHIIKKEAKKKNALIIPVDSEQSAIFQCLEGRRGNKLKKVYLTASGGPLHHLPKKKFRTLTTKDILNHPRWKMGKKITVDSATLMNKGLEIIEAKWLFDLAIQEIQIVVHPEAIIHSMVEFCDGSIIAQLGITDMRLPIQYALTYPERWNIGLKQMDFFELKQLTFKKPDMKKFPSLDLCFDVARRGGTLPSVLNAANEEAVEAFLEQKIRFLDIVRIVEKVVGKHKNILSPDLNGILESDRWARAQAHGLIFN